MRACERIRRVSLMTWRTQTSPLKNCSQWRGPPTDFLTRGDTDEDEIEEASEQAGLARS